MNNWPNQDKPGVPLNPEKDGWHWLRRAHDGRGICRSWSAKEKGWLDGITLSPATVVEWGVGYLGPALLPAEVAAQVEQARREGAEAMREAAARVVDRLDGVAAYKAMRRIHALQLPGDSE